MFIIGLTMSNKKTYNQWVFLNFLYVECGYVMLR